MDAMMTICPKPCAGERRPGSEPRRGGEKADHLRHAFLCYLIAPPSPPVMNRSRTKLGGASSTGAACPRRTPQRMTCRSTGAREQLNMIASSFTVARVSVSRRTAIRIFAEDRRGATIWDVFTAPLPLRCWTIQRIPCSHLLMSHEYHHEQ